MNTELLSLLQFAFTMTAHIIYPSISIGLITFIAINEALYLTTGDSHYHRLCRYWCKIFALTFGMGVVSGIAVSDAHLTLPTILRV